MADNQNPNFVVTYARTPESRFYMCRSCRNSLVSYGNEFSRDRMPGIIVCQNAVNVKTEGVEPPWSCDQLRVVNSSCRQCNSEVGQKIRSVMEGHPTSRFFRPGRFILYLGKMLFWDGSKVVYADTLQAAGDN